MNRSLGPNTGFAGKLFTSSSILAGLLALALPALADYPNTNTTKFVQWPAGYSSMAMDVCATSPYLVADDFSCTNAGPITDIHIWGAWQFDQMDSGATFELQIWTNVPATTNGTFITPSHPGAWLWYATLGPGSYSAHPVFTNTEPFLFPGQGFSGGSQVLWQYNFYPTNLFTQLGSITNPAVYWLGVVVFPQISGFSFGWKTSTNHFSDYALYSQNDGGTWQLIGTATTTNYADMAFALTTTAVATNPPAETPKYVQWPDPSTNGLDVYAQVVDIVADDFLCTNSGAISDIHIWCSWGGDQIGDTNADWQNIWLAIWSDVPAYGINASHPGQLLWNQWFGAGQYSRDLAITNVFEQCWDPSSGGYYFPDTKIFYYSFYPTNAFVQQGSPQIPTNYWLSVFHYISAGPFGWKTSTNHYQDRAVWAYMPGGTVPGGVFLPSSPWQVVTNHDYPIRRDMAFKLTTTSTQTNPPCCPETGSPKYVQGPNLTNGTDVDATFSPADVCAGMGWVLADDFPCTSSGQITDIHLWGSWLRDRVDPTAAFTLAIWSDVPTNAVSSFSHPGLRLWYQTYYGTNQYTLCPYTNIAETFADGYGVSPADPNCVGPALTTNLYYLCFDVPTSNPFYQTGTPAAPTNYWLSVTVQGTNYFGWKSSAIAYHDSAVGSPILSPNTNQWFPINDPSSLPLNLAFKITTQTNQCPPPTMDCSTNPPPVIQCGTPLIWITPSAYDRCCNTNIIPTFSDSTNGYCPWVISRIWKATDCMGQSVTCTQTVQVVNTNLPTLLVPTGGDLGCNPPLALIPSDASVLAQVAATDNCCVPSTNVNHSDTFVGCKLNRTFSITAQDCCSNSVTKQVLYSWTVDTNPPNLLLPTGGDLGCNPQLTLIPSDASVLAQVSVTDYCCVLSTNISHQYTGTACTSNLTFTITALDCCSNSVTRQVVYTWRMDTNAPTLFVPTGGDLGCNPSLALIPSDASVLAQVAVTDNCCVLGTNVYHNDTVVGCKTNRTFTITAFDCCSNTVAKQVLYSWTVDTTAPTLFVPTGGDLGCNPPLALIPDDAYVLVQVSVIDNCCVLSTNISHQYTGTACSSNRTFTVTALDCCSNSATKQVVYIWKVDTNAPTLFVPAGGDLGCNPPLALIPSDASVLAQVAVTDNCCVLGTNVYHTDTVVGCKTNRTFTITALDCCSNSATKQVVYTWTVDTTPPTITCLDDRTNECGSVLVFTPPLATSACCTNVVVLLSASTNGTTCSQVIRLTWRAIDCCSNVASCTQTVYVVDTTPPVVLATNLLYEVCSTNLTVPAYWTVPVTDLCSSVTVTSSPPSGSVFRMDSTTNIIQVTATDACGNRTVTNLLLTVTRPHLHVTYDSVHDHVIITWVDGGQLQSAANVTGPYGDIAGSSPFVVTPHPARQMFYRLRCYLP
jgi:hypothetical protein